MSRSSACHGKRSPAYIENPEDDVIFCDEEAEEDIEFATGNIIFPLKYHISPASVLTSTE
jgi:hypothetical protein